MCPPGTTTWLDASSVQRYGAILVDVTPQVERKVRAYAKLSSRYIDMDKTAKVIEGVSGLQGFTLACRTSKRICPIAPRWATGRL